MSLSKIFYIFTTVFVFLILGAYFLHPITNLVGDLGFYLKTGEIITQTKSIPSTNLLSYTNPTYPFINLNWLAEFIFFQIFHFIGFNGLIIISIFLAIISFAIIFITAVKKSDIFSVLVVSLISIQVLYERTDVKPELFSLLFFSLFISILYKYKDKYTKWIFLLIPLEFLWVNTHIFYFVGILLLILFLIDDFIVRKNLSVPKKTLTLIGVTIASFIATFLNPHFIKGAFYPLFVTNNYGFKVAENINYFTAIKSYTDPTFIFFAVSAIALWSFIFYSFKKMSPIDLMLAFVFTITGFFAVRAFPLFVFGTFIPFAVALNYTDIKLGKKFPKDKIMWTKIGLLSILMIILIPTINSNIKLHGFGFGVIDNASNAVNFLSENNIRGPIYNNYDIGSYLEYKLYPREKLFSDGRPEAYPKEFFQNTYIPMQTSPEIFKKLSDKYKFNVIVFSHTDSSIQAQAFLNQIIKNDDWKMVYLNNSVVIFLKNSKNNQKIINKYLITEKNVKLDSIDTSNKKDVGQLVNFFKAVDWENQWLKMNMKYLEYDPNNCAAIQNSAYLMQKLKNPEAQNYINKYLQSCVH